VPKLEPYDRQLSYSYALGLYPALNLMEKRPGRARRLLLHPGGIEGEGIAKLRRVCEALGVREEFAERVIRRESQKDNCYAAVVFNKYQDELAQNAPHVVLCQISDAGNLGTALRTCAAFGVRDVAVVRPAVDHFDPQVVRASMGAIFGVRVAVYDDFGAYRGRYPAHSLYPFMLGGSAPLEAVIRGRPEVYALIFGNEQTGLKDAYMDVGQSVRIPQSSEVDSLNLAVAIGIAVYAFAARDE